MSSYRFVFLNPGHFHAALVLREASPRLDSSIVVYAPDGPELDAFLALVESFNSRANNPTDWTVERRTGDIAQMVDDAAGDVAILAGANNAKLISARSIAASGMHVLADKPWLTDSSQLSYLDDALAGPGTVMDIMTIRHEILSRLCHAVVRTPSVFGEFQKSESQNPAIELGSIHHLYKMVNGRPLKRPQWYYDIRVQGDGVVDIQSHLIEQAMWFVNDDAPVDVDAISLVSARRWATPVDAGLFEASTGAGSYPDNVRDSVDDDGVLQYQCNGEINWSLNDVHISQSAQWRQREPEGAGDLHRVVLRGTRAVVHVEQGEHTRFKAEVHVEPAHPNTRDELVSNARSELESWRTRFPGLELVSTRDGFRFDAPTELDDGHESHFPLVRDSFLDALEGKASLDATQTRIRERYRLIAAARDLALEAIS